MTLAYPWWRKITTAVRDKKAAGKASSAILGHPHSALIVKDASRDWCHRSPPIVWPSVIDEKNPEENIMLRRTNITGLAAIALGLAVASAQAQSTIKIGALLPMTGPQQPTGVQVAAGMRLYMAQHGDVVAGKKIEVIMKDDGAVADKTKRLAQELIVNDKVNFFAGFGITPTALAVTPLATEAKIPQIVMAASTSIITERSPYVVRTSCTLAQSSVIMADWALKNGIKKVVSIVSDYAPDIDAENFFKETFLKGGGQIPESIRTPLANPDFAPFLQRARDAKPDAIFVFEPAGLQSVFVRQFLERGLDKAGIKIIGPGDVTDDDVLNRMGDQVIGTVTAHYYSAYHQSAMNKDYAAAISKANNNMRPNFMSVGGYDGMHLIYEALEKTNGATGGDALIAAMKGMAWESPRGPISIDPETRDIVQNVYICARSRRSKASSTTSSLRLSRQSRTQERSRSRRAMA
jgi:branched-chain amino acid transport system substrate-binding protein